MRSILLSIAILFILYVCVQKYGNYHASSILGRYETGTAGSESNALTSPRSSKPTDSDTSGFNSSSDPEKSPVELVGYRAIVFGPYEGYLDSLCSRITQAEVDRLLNDPATEAQTLIGLIFAGAKRPDRLLKKAFERDPSNPLVHYAILGHPNPTFDRAASALELAESAPRDAAPLYAAALEAINSGDRRKAIAYLNEASSRPEFSSFQQRALDAAIDTFELLGRKESGAAARVYLQNNGEWEISMIGRLRDALGVLGPDKSSLWAPHEVALLLEGTEKALSSRFLDLATYQGALFEKMNYADVISQSPEVERFSQYLPVPVSEWLTHSRAREAELDPILLFARDKAGVYQRLDSAERMELVNRVSADGEIAAFLWAYTLRPEIFRSKDFRPESAAPLFWDRYVAENGKVGK